MIESGPTQAPSLREIFSWYDELSETASQAMYESAMGIVCHRSDGVNEHWSSLRTVQEDLDDF